MPLLLFLYYWLKLLIPAVIAQSCIPTAERVMPTRTQTNEANAEIETQLVIAEAKKIKFSAQFKYLHVFWYF